MLPLFYSLRNLGRFPWKTLQMVLGSTIVVFLIVSASAFNRGITACLSVTGDPNNVIVLGAGSEESIQRSEIARIAPDILASSVREIKRILDKPAVSSEVYYMGTVALPDEPKKNRPALYRGVTWNALNVHRNVIITEGRFPGSSEVMVGRQVARHIGVKDSDLAIGKSILFEGISYRIVGQFQGEGTMMEAEFWMDINDLLTASKRETVSCAAISLSRPHDFEAISLFCMQRLDLELSAMREQDYYASLSNFYQPIRIGVWLTALLISIAAVFGGINTAYAAIIVRRREMAALQVIGCSRFSLIFSLLVESSMINLMGAFISLSLASVWLPSIHVSFSTGVFNMVFDNHTLTLGFLSAGIMAVAGIIMPAWGCLKPTIVSSLRST
ncbi:MAG: ABC transporter permease [Candidatus Brocadiae bacterium]|nr:ABC transporter permease [Candidatus Brocadiia bacterium]